MQTNHYHYSPCPDDDDGNDWVDGTSSCLQIQILYSFLLLLHFLLVLPRARTRPQTQARCGPLHSRPQTWSRLNSTVTFHGHVLVRIHNALVLVPVPVPVLVVPVPVLVLGLVFVLALGSVPVPVSVPVIVPVPTRANATGLTTRNRPRYPGEDADSARTPWIFFLHLAALRVWLYPHSNGVCIDLSVVPSLYSLYPVFSLSVSVPGVYTCLVRVKEGRQGDGRRAVQHSNVVRMNGPRDASRLLHGVAHECSVFRLGSSA